MPAIGTQKAAYRSLIDFSAVGNAGYTFAGWTIKPAGSVEYVTGDQNSVSISVRILSTDTITANFNGIQYTVQVNTGNSLYGTVSPSIQQVSYNGGFIVIATPKRGCKFTGWVLDSGVMTIGNVLKDTTTISAVLSNGKIKAVFDTIPAIAGVVYVDSAVVAPLNEQTGGSWFHAYAKLETGLSAGGNKEVWVTKGTYSPATTTPFSPVSNSKIYGGFNAIEISKDQRNFIINKTVLSAGINASTTLQMVSLQKTLVDGFLITGSKSNGYELYCDVPDSVTICNSVIENEKRDSYGGICASGNSRTQVISFFNTIVTRIKSIDDAPIYVNNITIQFINSIMFDNSVDASNGSSGCFDLAGNTNAIIIHSAFINNVVINAISGTRPNCIYKSSSASIKSTLRIFNSILWNDPQHSQNGRFLVNLIDSLANDKVNYCILDSAKVRTKYLKSNGNTWEGFYLTNPVFVSLNIPGGTTDENWFTSNCGLIYAQDKPGVNDGYIGYIDYVGLGLDWDMRGNGFKRVTITPDIGPFEKQ